MRGLVDHEFPAPVCDFGLCRFSDELLVNPEKFEKKKKRQILSATCC